MFDWLCPECKEGKCEIVNLSNDMETEIQNLDQELMLEEVELQILETLFTENRDMRAGEISVMIDVTYQLVGKRTAKLKDSKLVSKNVTSGSVVNSITEIAIKTYFDN